MVSRFNVSLWFILPGQQSQLKIKACKFKKAVLDTFGGIWHKQIKNSFILSGTIASPLKPTAKNVAPPPPPSWVPGLLNTFLVDLFDCFVNLYSMLPQN